ncbi:Methyltransferase type 12 [Tumidithrix helvetica PCC 7403]|uniref:class I SAM-dependent methyltransferase n=1 Tax=Tumidithrix helvetica TaxID=3457545 RepID=UPI003CA3AAE3
MKISECYNCGSRQHTFYAEENGFSLVKCDQCGLLFVENRPDDREISQAHKQGKHVGVKEFDVTGRFRPSKIPQYLKVLENLFKGDLGSKKTWLDIGCGHGEFMTAVQKYSSGKVTVKGTEPNVHKQESAISRGLNVSYFDIESHEERYDVISMLNVYSHLPDPPTFLRSVKKLLNPGGELILETGDAAGFSANDQPRPFCLPDHLSFASEDILIGILARLDFEILRINKYSFMQFDLNSMARELVKAILPQYKSRIGYYLKWKMYAQTDMFIRARIKS